MEEWKRLERYAVSNYGRVMAIDSIRPGIIQFCKDKKGYLRMCVYKNNKHKVIRIHTLVWDLFGDGNRRGFHVDHVDENKENNFIDNLQLLTPRENFYKTRKIKRENYSSKFLGVSWSGIANMWTARKKLNGVYKSLGYFKNEYDAHLAFEAA